MSAQRFVALGLMAVALLGGCGEDGGDDTAAPTTTAAQDDDAGDGTTVVLKGNKYTPQSVTVEKGDTVSWEWDDGAVPHDVNGGDAFKSEIQEKGTFEHTFDEAGTFEYKCSVHPTMTGSVEVTE